MSWMRDDKKLWRDKEQGGRGTHTQTGRVGFQAHRGDRFANKKEHNLSLGSCSPVLSVCVCVETVFHLLQQTGQESFAALSSSCLLSEDVRLCVLCFAIKTLLPALVRSPPAQLCFFGCHPHSSATAASIHSTGPFLFPIVPLPLFVSLNSFIYLLSVTFLEWVKYLNPRTEPTHKQLNIGVLGSIKAVLHNYYDGTLIYNKENCDSCL